MKLQSYGHILRRPVQHLHREHPMSGHRVGLQLRLILASALVFLGFWNVCDLHDANAFGKKASREIQVCSNLILTHPIEGGDFSDNEKKLACGQFSKDSNPKPNNSGSKSAAKPSDKVYDEKDMVEAWKEIPENQRRFHIKTFLQNRGYLAPVFSIAASSESESQDTGGDEILRVDPGPLTVITVLEAVGAPSDFDYSRKREVIGKALTPGMLDLVKSWTEARLGGLGYACAKVDPRGDPATGIVRVNIDAGDKVRFGVIDEKNLPELLPGILRRYDAFIPNDPYNSDLLRLTERRAVTDGQVEGMRYRPECSSQSGQNGDSGQKSKTGSITKNKNTIDQDPNDPTPIQQRINQEVVIGKPRLLSFGVGANTEGILLGQASWRNTRLGNTASLLDVTLTTSSIHQLLTSYAEWYFLNVPSRIFMRPQVSIEHVNWDPYETLTGTVDFSPATTWESSRFGFYTKLGPIYDYIKTFRGSGPPTSHFLYLEWQIRASTHYFDFYKNSPRSGMQVQLTTDVNSGSALSSESAQRITLSYEGLWNLKEFDPPFLVIGLRGFAASTIVGQNDPMGLNLPPTFLQFLGGSTSVRGYGLQELPHSGTGTLAAFYTGTEIRYAAGLWFGLQPLIFMDFGALGSYATQLNSPVFLSPGGGLRYESPFGSLRATLAHGYAPGSNDPTLSHYQFFFSFGEEF
jgi:translocation and assembly module TamA